MKIARETLQFILEVCKSSAPREFAGMLSAQGDVITEVIVVPGTESSDALSSLDSVPGTTITSVITSPCAESIPANSRGADDLHTSSINCNVSLAIFMLYLITAKCIY